MIREPRVSMPGYTCPEIDSIISQLEDLRAQNDALRQWCAYWEEKTAEAQVDRGNVEQGLDASITILETHVGKLETENRELKIALAEYTE